MEANPSDFEEHPLRHVLAPNAHGRAEHPEVDVSRRQVGGDGQAIRPGSDNNDVGVLAHAAFPDVASQTSEISEQGSDGAANGNIARFFVIIKFYVFLMTDWQHAAMRRSMVIKKFLARVRNIVQARILIATTTWWPSAARLAAAFRALGAEVSAVCPRGNPIRVVQHLRAAHDYAASAPLRALMQAVRAEQPDLIVPMDDRVVSHLHELHATTGSGQGHDDVRAVIERSLGAPDGYSLSGTRQRLLEAMRAEGVMVPEGRTIRSREDLQDWHRRHPGPCVIKAEGSWGGSGVVVAHTQDAAEAAFLEMSRPLAWHRALRMLLVDLDPFPFVQFLRRERRGVAVQAYVAGRQANIMAACWRGQVLGTLGVEVLRAQGRTGAATVIRPTRNGEMEAAAGATARRLGLSGFFGLDFMVEEATGRHLLIEMNPRATQLGHIVRDGRTLASRLFAALGGTAAAFPDGQGEEQAIALFPQALRFEADWPGLGEARLDVPWDEPELVAELLRRPWTKRSPLARLEARLRRNDAYGTVLSPTRTMRIMADLAQSGSVLRGAAGSTAREAAEGLSGLTGARPHPREEASDWLADAVPAANRTA